MAGLTPLNHIRAKHRILDFFKEKKYLRITVAVGTHQLPAKNFVKYLQKTVMKRSNKSNNYEIGECNKYP